MAGPTSGDRHVLGVISDTHGLLRPEAVAALAGVERIVHAGDVGSADVLEGLAVIAPVTAVRGNVDVAAWCESLPRFDVVSVAGVTVYVVHDLADLDLDPHAAGFDVVIHGHSHRPRVDRERDLLWLNPGAAGPRRFDLPVSVARVTIAAGSVEAQIVVLNV